MWTETELLLNQWLTETFMKTSKTWKLKQWNEVIAWVTPPVWIWCKAEIRFFALLWFTDTSWRYFWIWENERIETWTRPMRAGAIFILFHSRKYNMRRPERMCEVHLQTATSICEVFLLIACFHSCSSKVAAGSWTVIRVIPAMYVRHLVALYFFCHNQISTKWLMLHI